MQRAWSSAGILSVLTLMYSAFDPEIGSVRMGPRSSFPIRARARRAIGRFATTVVEIRDSTSLLAATFMAANRSAVLETVLAAISSTGIPRASIDSAALTSFVVGAAGTGGVQLRALHTEIC